MFNAYIAADSIYKNGPRLTSVVATFPRVILPEMNTHTVLSKNTSSSRAIPYKRMSTSTPSGAAPSMRDMVVDCPYLPIYWGRNQTGMQARTELDSDSIIQCKKEILSLRDMAISTCDELFSIGLHKQDLNRYLEPWAWTTQILTGTNWSNFFALRTHKDAHPAFQWIAKIIYLRLRSSTPIDRSDCSWHLPFVSDLERATFDLHSLQMMSVARCARVSYNNHDGTACSPTRNFELFSGLTSAFPGHWSPTMHQACPLGAGDKRVSNLFGWLQYRKTFANENIFIFEPTEVELLTWSSETGIAL